MSDVFDFVECPTEIVGVDSSSPPTGEDLLLLERLPAPDDIHSKTPIVVTVL